ncbi:MAG TPA: hypothetical protein VFU73_03700 [Actinocrinis sp.]|nr:hypothetical protein [Actinocrinis sp.]
MTRRLYDASSPPPDPHLDVCGFYIGGDTPHVWSDAEIAGQSARWRLPIYVCDNPGQRDPASDAGAAVAWLRSHGVPPGCALALDFETAVNGGYVTAFDKVVRSAGWTLLLYGSLSSVTQNPRPSAGYWTASWTGAAHLDAGAAATQYISDTQLGRPYDLSEVSDALVLWDTRPSAFGSASRNWRNDMHIDLAKGDAKIFTPPAAVLGGTCTLLLSCDFGDAVIRVAVYSFSGNSWAVSDHSITAAGGTGSITLSGDANKVSLVYSDGTATAVGADVY